MLATIASAVRPARQCIAGLLLCITATAQDTTIEQSSTERTTKIEAHLEKPYTVKLEAKPHENFRCRVNVTVEYMQKSDVAYVESVVSNDDCGASSGTYDVAMRLVDDNQVSREITFQESWQRTDDQPVTYVNEYPIGDNVDLKRVRTRKLSCTCVDPIVQQAEH